MKRLFAKPNKDNEKEKVKNVVISQVIATFFNTGIDGYGSGIEPYFVLDTGKVMMGVPQHPYNTLSWEISEEFTAKVSSGWGADGAGWIVEIFYEGDFVKKMEVAK